MGGSFVGGAHCYVGVIRRVLFCMCAVLGNDPEFQNTQLNNKEFCVLRVQSNTTIFQLVVQ